jgi:hypothetical protein
MAIPAGQEQVRALLSILRGRRSRRFGLGMKMPAGPLAFTSQAKPMRLSEGEEALLAYAACGVTGHALADLAYAPGQGGTMMAGFLGRTIPSGDALHTTALIVMNEEATYYLKRPQDFAPGEVAELVRLAEQGEYVELYRRSRVKIRDGRIAPPNETPYNVNVNQWSLYDPAATYFLPVTELTFMYINGLLESFNDTTAFFLLDERAGFRPAGIKRFGRSQGGFLRDDPRDNHLGTVQKFESLLTEFAVAEQFMMIQNLALMAQALGLGGFPHWAAHPFAWFEALDFQTVKMDAGRYLGLSGLQRLLARWFKLDLPISLPVGLERNGQSLLKPFCPPHYPSMAAAVRAVVDCKFGPRGVFRGDTCRGSWTDASAIATASAACSDATVAAAIAYCEYIYGRYGRFPAYDPPLRTGLGFQVSHVDIEFYDRFYRPEALTETQREHMKNWHAP